ncbi:MAG: protein kinase [Elusimicrobia bacterium]|nr:protein kinase [Elusimicrobiota bacterium]
MRGFVLALACLLLASSPAAAAARSDGPPAHILRQAYDSIKEDPPFPGQQPLLQAMEALLRKTRDASAERRQAVVREGLDEINAAASSLELFSAPPAARRKACARLAWLNNSAGHWEQALRLSDLILLDQPQDPDALLSRATARFGLKDYQGSLADAEAALRADPGNPLAHRAKAMAAYGLGNEDVALAQAKMALALDPDDATASALAKLSENKVRAVSLELYRSDLPAQIRRQYHNTSEQISQVEENIRYPSGIPGPPSAARLLQKAADKIALKDYPGAVEEAARALASDPGSFLGHYYRAAAYNLLGEYEKAVQDATRALVLRPSDTAARDARAWAFNRLGRPNDAIADSFHSLEINPKNPYAFANLGASHELQGDLTSMLSELKEAALLSPLFEAAYRDAAARHGLEPEPLPSSHYQGASPIWAQRKQARRNAFLALALSAALGGSLIALGLLRPGKPPRRSHRDGGGDGLAEIPTAASVREKYEIGKTIGMGGMGVIFEGFDRSLQRKVAIKMIREELKVEAEARARLLEEARTVACLHHPHIIDIYSIIEDDTGLYLVFELVDGEPLDHLLREKKRLSLAESKRLLRQVCEALDFAHERQIIHRDLKPSNIMVTPEGVAKIMDFGISCHGIGRQDLSLRETAAGTPEYMSPEQSYGRVLPESDIFSLGVCLYEMLTGLRPYPGSAGAAIKASRDYHKASQIAPNIPAAADELIAWALHPNPDKRIHTAGRFWKLLEAIEEPALPTLGR